MNVNKETDDAGGMEPRTKQLTEKGLSFWKDNKKHSIRALCKKLKINSRDIDQQISDGGSMNDVQPRYVVWLTLYEEFLDQLAEYKELFSDPESQADFKEESEVMLNFKSRVEQWHNIKTSRLSQDVKVSDSVSQASFSKPVGKAPSCVSSGGSCASSARLREKQKIAELEAKAKALRELHVIQLEKLKLEMAENELQLKTELSIAQARENAVWQFEEQGLLAEKKSLNLQIDNKELSGQPQAANTGTQRQAYKYTDPPFYNLPTNTFVPSSRHHKEPEIISEVEDRGQYAQQEYNVSDYVPSEAQQSSMSNSNKDALLTIVQHLRKPVPEINKFSGDPLEFRKFLRQFDTKIVCNSSCEDEKLNYLEQFTSGEAHKIVSGYSYLDGRKGYKAARTELEERYGREDVLASAFVKRAMSWPLIKGDNSKSLDDFAIFLAECSNAIKSIEAVKILEYPDNIKRLIAKLPFYCHEKWRTIVEKTRKQELTINFQHLVDFVKEEARKATDPTFGKEAISSLLNTEKSSSSVKKSRNQSGKSSFVTSTTEVMNNQPQSFDKEKRVNSSESSFANRVCDYCQSSSHDFQVCEKFMLLPYKDRILHLKKNGCCYGCLKRGHLKSDCKKKLSCNVCRGRHVTALHDYDRKPKENQDVTSTVKAYSNVSWSNPSLAAGVGEGSCTMAVIPVCVKLKNSSKVVHTLAFLDPGSSATFCTERLMRDLGAQGSRVKIFLDTMAKPFAMTTYAVSGIEIGDTNLKSFIQLPKVYTKDRIPVTTSHFPTKEDISAWKHLQDLQLPEIDGEVGLLIGNNIADAYAPQEVRTGPSGSPFAIRTRLGWVVWCLVRIPVNADTSNKVTVNRTSITAIEEIDELKKLNANMQKAINIDFPERVVNERRELSQEDKKFLEIVDNSMRLVDGHYQMPLPFRNPDVNLPNNREQAVQRLRGIKNKMLKSEEFYKDYCSFMAEILQNHYAELVPDDEINRADNKVWYIPHHGVYHPKKPGKIRIVFDCGAQYLGVSLNNLLLQGPDLTNNLVSVLLRFRQGKIAIMADIKSMFHQVHLTKDDRDCLRFLWWPDGDFERGPQIYRMTVHLFGAVSSPSCCNAALKRTAKDNHDSFSKNTLDVIDKSFYVDDCLKSVDSQQEAIQLSADVTKLCQKGGFLLHKWISNNSEVVESIAPENRAKELKNLDIGVDDLPNERALGVHWAVKKDCFGFEIQIKDKPATRRGILSVTSSFYDPLGFAAPFTLVGKILLQELCRRNVGWDEPITGMEKRRWLKWLDDLPSLQEIELPRCYKAPDLGRIVKSDLHVFSDASDKGYGVVIYLRFVDNLDKIHCSFVMAKSRVVPLKKITVPRLELTAATLGAKMSLMIQKDLEFPVEVKFWTDSMSVIRYIRSETGRFQTFVANRVSVIREISKPDQWDYIETNNNPADAASRGQLMKDFKDNNIWRKGPLFLWQPESNWLRTLVTNEPDCNDPEVKQPALATLIPAEDVMSRLIDHYSSWWKLKRVLGWTFYACKNLKKRVEIKHRMNEELTTREPDPDAKLATVNKKITTLKNSGPVNAKDLTLPNEFIQKAEDSIIRYVQKQHFSDEIEKLTETSNVGGPSIRSSTISKLDPILVNGILRVGGRLHRAKISYEAKHPILLPKNSAISQLILRETHISVGHMGKNYILSAVREKYWILGASSLIKSMLSKCVTCRRYYAKVGEQKMADMPKDRLIPEEPPFTRVGLDFFGPFMVKQGRSTVKRYGAIFSCLATRAVHLEIAFTMDTDSCINCIRRFIARRGSVKVIRCDNGTNLVGSKHELAQEIQRWNQSHLDAVMQQKEIRWEFNPPAGSHFGGVWERIIRSVRKVVYSLLQEQVIKLSDEGLQTLFCEVECILNSRPLTEMPTSPSDLKAITPQDLLSPHSNETLPPGTFSPEDTYFRRRWRQVQYLSNVFWQRWRKDYLPLLQQRQKWHHVRRNIKVGDLVLLVDNSPRLSWTLGRVQEVINDSKGAVRMVKVKTKSSILVRPIDKLCVILEADYPDTN